MTRYNNIKQKNKINSDRNWYEFVDSVSNVKNEVVIS